MSTKRIVIAIVAVVGAVIVLALVFGGKPEVTPGPQTAAADTVTPPAPSYTGTTPAIKNPTTLVKLDGVYEEEAFGMWMVATVKDGKITIVRKIGDDSTQLQWVGTFPQTAADGSTISSKRNNAAMSAEDADYVMMMPKLPVKLTDGDTLTYTEKVSSLKTIHKLVRR